MKRCPAIVLMSLAFVMQGCKPQTAAPAANAEPTEVVAQVIEPQRIKDVIELDGVVAPLQQVNLVARVAGALETVDFHDGERVKRGQKLFSIESASYVEQVKLNQARLNQSRSDYQRQAELLKENANSQANVDSSLANLQQAEANVRVAQINLEYTVIKAPFDGVMGRRQVDPANYVGATAGGTVLATIMQISPAYVNAAVGEREALRIRRKAAAGDRNAASGVGRLAVHAQLQGESGTKETGVFDFIDHQVTQSSGTVALRGRFANANRHLVPGFYAKLIIDLGAERQIVALPRTVLLSDQGGEFVFVVGSDNLARRRNITTAPLPGEGKEITSGLSAGERVVVVGQGKLTDGHAVRVSAPGKPGATR